MAENPGDQRLLTRWYVIPSSTADRQLVEQACLALLDIVRPRAKRARIDAYSDHRQNLPALAQAAQHELRVRGSLRTGSQFRDAGMAIELDPLRQADWELLRAYASLSIHVELDGLDGELAHLDDCGTSIRANLTEAEADRLAAILPEPLNLEPEDRGDRGGKTPGADLLWPLPKRQAKDGFRAVLGLLADLAVALIAGALGAADAAAPTVRPRRSLRMQARRVAAGKRVSVPAWWTEGRLSPEPARVRLSAGQAVLERSFTNPEDLRQFQPVALFSVGQAPAGGAHHAGLRWLELATPKGVRYLGAGERDLALIGRCAGWRYPPIR